MEFAGDQFYLTVTSSNVNGFPDNKHNDFYASLPSMKLHSGEWEVACIGFKPVNLEKVLNHGEEGVAQGPFTLRSSFYNPASEEFSKATITTTLFTWEETSQSGEKAFIELSPSLVHDISSMINKEYNDVADMVSSIPPSNTPVQVPYSFDITDNQTEIRINILDTIPGGFDEVFYQVQFNVVAADMFGFTHKTVDGNFLGETGNTEFLFRVFADPNAARDPLPEADRIVNCVYGVSYYTGKDPNNPSAPNPNPLNHAIYFGYNDEILYHSLLPLPQLIHVHMDKIENNPTTVVNSMLNKADVLMIAPGQDEYYIPKVFNYHRLEKSSNVLERMHFTITDQDYVKLYDTLPAPGGKVFRYNDVTLLYLHFKRIGVYFQGKRHKDVVDYKSLPYSAF